MGVTPEDTPVVRADFTTAESAKAAAANMLVRIGFQLKYTSPSGSQYFHYSGRSGGTLRLSGHRKSKTIDTAARLTIHDAHMPVNDDTLRNMVASAVGQYFICTRME